MSSLAESYVLENQNLRVEVPTSTMSLHVTDKASGATWRMCDDSYDEIILERSGQITKERFAASKAISGQMIGQSGLLLTFADFHLQLLVSLEDNQLRVQITPLEENEHFKIRGVHYPRSFKLSQAQGAYSVYPYSQGVMIPGNWGQEAYSSDPFPFKTDKRMQTFSELFNMNVEWWSSRSAGYSPAMESVLLMPWWGAVEQGGSFLAVLDEDCWADSNLGLSHPAGGPTRYSLVWLPSWGKLNYPRRVSFYFYQGGTYVTLAKEYRKIAQARGKCVTLREKNEKNPTISRLLGAANCTIGFLDHSLQRVHHRIVHMFAEAAPLVETFHKKTGIARLHVHARSWQQRGHDIQYPDLVPPAPDCGGPVEFDKMATAIQKMGDIFGLGGDNYHDVAMDSPMFDESMLLRYADGSTNRRNFWASGLTSLVCAGVAPKYLRRNFEVGRTDYPSALGLLETAHPDTYWIGNYISSYECYDPRHPLTRNTYWDAQRGIFQYINDCGLLLDNEHPKDWAAPYFYRARTSQACKGVYGYNKHGDIIAVPVPLWTLVYHDCLATGGDSAPLQMMNGAPPTVNLENFDEFLVNRVKTHCRLHAAVGLEAMVNHEYLGTDLSVQQSVFANGVSVQIDTAKNRYKITGVSGIPETQMEGGKPGETPWLS